MKDVGRASRGLALARFSPTDQEKLAHPAAIPTRALTHSSKLGTQDKVTGVCGYCRHPLN